MAGESLASKLALIVALVAGLMACEVYAPMRVIVDMPNSLNGGSNSKELGRFSGGQDVDDLILAISIHIDAALQARGFDGGALQPDSWHWATLTVRTSDMAQREWKLGVQFLRRRAVAPIEARVRSYSADGFVPEEYVLDRLLQRLRPAVEAAATVAIS